jgi:REP element-mobilizing transposase RayT
MPGFSYRGHHAYLVTLCAFGRRPALVIPDVADLVAVRLLQSACRHRMDVLAYCLMPDHLHAVCQGRSPSADLQAFAAGWKVDPARWFRREYGGQLWQKGYHDSVLLTDEAVTRAIAYTVLNPVRAGFVSTPRRWPFIGASACSSADLIRDVLGPLARP